MTKNSNMEFVLFHHHGEILMKMHKKREMKFQKHNKVHSQHFACHQRNIHQAELGEALRKIHLQEPRGRQWPSTHPKP